MHVINVKPVQSKVHDTIVMSVETLIYVKNAIIELGIFMNWPKFSLNRIKKLWKKSVIYLKLQIQTIWEAQ